VQNFIKLGAAVRELSTLH